ncbi:hypothetical protein IPM62_02325 [Candidatus Woesebacteria bacterium]|nr:MAG: hypothetical protein IPM62_02325 [Candidatus Woesebacteria bacterium]
MDPKKVAVTALVLVVGLGGIVSGALLLRRNTEIRDQAAVPGGRGSVKILPNSGSYNVSDNIPVSVYFNTDGVPVSGVSVRISYPFSGTTPEVTVSNVVINPALTSNADWSCPTKNVAEVGGNINVDVACANLGAAGFSSTTDTLLASFNLTIARTPSALPFSVKVDPISTITQKSNGEDILASDATTTAVYTIGGTVSPTTALSVTPTSAVKTTLTPTGKLTTTPTKIPTATKAATGSAMLPDAGIATPTFAVMVVGLIAVFASLALAL